MTNVIIPLVVVIIIVLILFFNTNQHLIKRPIENDNVKIVYIDNKDKPPLDEVHHFDKPQANVSTSNLDPNVLEYLGDRGPALDGPMMKPNLYDSIPGNGPVPRGTLKETSEKYKRPFYQGLLGPKGSFETVGGPPLLATPPQAGFSGIGNMTPLSGFGGFPSANRPLKGFDYFKPFGPNPEPERIEREASYADVPFYSSTDAYAPMPEINTKWEKMGIVSTTNEADDSIMNLYRRPIAPLQDLWEYSTQDKNGFILKLKNTNFLENGDIIPYIEGKQNKGPWKVVDYVKDKYVLM